jgi:putative endonuclease
MNPALPNKQRKGIGNWYYVYLLGSAVTNWIYIGCTNDLKKRLMEHTKGNVFSTKKMLPVELIYFEAYKSKECAYKREKQLKQYGSGLSKLKSRIGIKNEGRAG